MYRGVMEAVLLRISLSQLHEYIVIVITHYKKAVTSVAAILRRKEAKIWLMF